MAKLLFEIQHQDPSDYTTAFQISRYRFRSAFGNSYGRKNYFLHRFRYFYKGCYFLMIHLKNICNG